MKNEAERIAELERTIEVLVSEITRLRKERDELRDLCLFGDPELERTAREFKFTRTGDQVGRRSLFISGAGWIADVEVRETGHDQAGD